MDRTEMQFADAVEVEFRFLVAEFGFRLVKFLPTFVRFESSKMFLNVYHGRLSYEIGVEVGRISKPEGYRYQFPEVLDALLGRDDKRGTYFQASERENVRGCVQTIASLVAKHYRAVLLGDPIVLKQIEAYTSERNKMDTRELIEQPIKKAAEKAWREKDYAKVCELYGPILQHLTPVERKRFEYADKTQQAFKKRRNMS